MAVHLQRVGQVIQDLGIKVQVGDDTRVISINPNGTYEELLLKTRQAFPTASIGEKQVFKYEDAGRLIVYSWQCTRQFISVQKYYTIFLSGISQTAYSLLFSVLCFQFS